MAIEITKMVWPVSITGRKETCRTASNIILGHMAFD